MKAVPLLPTWERRDEAATAVMSRAWLPPGVVIAAAVGMCAGTAAAGAIGASWLVPVLVAAATLAALRPEVRRPAILLAVAALAAQLGVWRMQATENALAQERAEVRQLTGVQQIRGLVADEPVPRGRTTSLTLSNVLVNAGGGWQPLGARVLVSVPPWPEHDYGEQLQLRGKLQPLAGSGAVEALGRQGVLASMSYPRVSYLANPEANPALVAIWNLRRKLAGTIAAILPEPAASVLQATILGLRTALPKDEQQALVATGTVHLIVISGFKLSLVAAGLEAIGLAVLRLTTARLLARAGVSGAVLAAIAGYTILTGATPSAERAAIMAGLVVLAVLAGRPRDQLAALAVAVLCIVSASPVEVQDAGFQLSCLSVLGISLLSEPLASWLRRPARTLPGVLKLPALALAEALAASLAATAFDVPVLAGSFHVVSLISPIANLAGMPLLMPIMGFGGFGALLGSVWLPLGSVLLWPAWAFTSVLDWVVTWSAAVPHASLPLDGMPPPAVVAYYAALLGATWLLIRRQSTAERLPPHRGFAWATMLAAALAAVLAAAFSGRPPDTVEASLLAVPGQAALIRTPSGHTVLVDGGSSGPALVRELGQLLPPWRRTLDLVVITSPAADHIAALPEALSRYHAVALLALDVSQPSVTFRRLQAAAPRESADVIDLGDGAMLRRDAQGWRLESGDSSLAFADGAFDLHIGDADRRIAASTRDAQTDDLSLADTGTLTLPLH